MVTRFGPPIAGAATVAALGFTLIGSSSPASAKAVPACAPAAPQHTVEVRLKTYERGKRAPLVATHHAAVVAEFTGSPTNISIRAAGARVIKMSRAGDIAELLVPRISSLPITVSWRQSIKNFREEPTSAVDTCAASSTITLPVAAALPVRGLRVGDWRQGHTQFAVVPATVQPDLSPVEITVRTTPRARYPSRRSRARRMVLPMRTVDRVKYRRSLPPLAGISVAKRCRFYDLTCGSVFTEVRSLPLDREALRDGIERGDWNSRRGTALAHAQPRRVAARYGLRIELRPGAVRVGKPRSFGYDVQIRQAGELLVRVRAAGRCLELRRTRGLACKVKRSVRPR